MVTLTIRDLTFSYRSAPVLQGLSLEVGEGSVLGLVGPNGSGKTTLIKCIDHILRPKGSILIDDREIARMEIEEIARAIGYVPQSSPPMASFTVFDMVLMGRRSHMGWCVGEEDIAAVARVMKRLNIDGLAMKNFNELSGGQKQKILIARALAQDPAVLLLDEPTSSLDLRHQLEAMEYVRSLVDTTGITVVISIHDLNLAARYCDTMAMMKEGVIAAAGPPARLITAENIREVYGVEARLLDNDGGAPVVVPLRAADAGRS
ncbi:ABC transporter ATP-binding protein [Methanofollis formosanus]|uniref:Cobalamin import ATP-binding protein BtuD n=1 Tax=Methanofollis formosanus TaxID=299308 RepID=A0A8G1A4X2_9EURY|nr:ABC transporter ATP-binding protein [Methanofollis formosanus]QYZ80157.1 ABC transporter ATP-binding protein [Methanofollis formosanus]